MAIYKQVSDALDVFGQAPGSILYRDTDVWKALPPGDPGDVLVINDQGMPEWQPPT